MTHAVLGGLVAVGWLVLSVTWASTEDPTVWSEGGQVTAVAAPPGQDGTSTGDLALPLIAVVAAGALAAYTYTRRIRRARTRTTPGGAIPHPVPFAELDRRSRQSLVEADDCVRTSAEELGWAGAQFGDEAVGPYTEAVAFARAELAEAFRLRQRLDETVPDDGLVRRQLLEEIVARCREAGRRLDAEAAGFDLLRALERTLPAALELAESRFRELAGRTPAAEATHAELHERYGPAASLPVAGHIEQAKDRLVFATTHLNQARQSLDRGEDAKATASLRAAEGAVDQAGLFVAGVDRLAAELASAAERLPTALAGAEADLARARGLPDGAVVGALPGRIAHAESLVTEVRREMTSGPYDPLGALRRVARAKAALADAPSLALTDERVRALLDEARLPVRSAVALAADFVTTHRGAVDGEARTRLAEAERHLAPASPTLADVQRADELARDTERLAERDVLAYGNPYAGPEGTGVGGAVLGGILLGNAPGAPAASFGGPRTRNRRAAPGDGTPPPNPPPNPAPAPAPAPAGTDSEQAE
ncbi:hypothetical protein AB0D57_11235 [Streptomyces sp. NPDC048275]|uniref:hypothetical protein n=1 Tax=Streptomyces sp. NPDC048275 TaxID=3155629 RepID=UPI0034045607